MILLVFLGGFLNAEHLFLKRVQDPDDPKIRCTKESRGRKAVYHPLFPTGDGTYHWTGSSIGKNKTGRDMKVLENQIPVEIRRLGEN